MNGLDDSDENENEFGMNKMFPDTGCMDDSVIHDEIPVRETNQSVRGGGKVSQVHIDSDDDISSGAHESSDDEQPKQAIIKLKSNGLKKLQAPGNGGLK
jgi:hypothetical protein